jgi:uroporphyrinogen decarboxylase
MPIAEAKRRWGGRIALLGGVDVDFLCRRTPREIKEYTKRILDACAPGGGYALGSGNTITNYMPIENYEAMLEAGREFNGLA